MAKTAFILLLSQLVLLFSTQQTIANRNVQFSPEFIETDLAPVDLVEDGHRRSLEEHDAMADPDEENETEGKVLTVNNANDRKNLRVLQGDEVTTTYVIHNGKMYMTLDSVDPNDTTIGCQESPIQLPAGFQVAKNTADAQAVIAAYGWGTHCVILADGSSWGTKNFYPGADCWINKDAPLVEYNLDGFLPRDCARRILIEAKTSKLPACTLEFCTSLTPATCEAPNKNNCTCEQLGKTGPGMATILEVNAIGYHNRVYRTMDATNPDNSAIGCQNFTLTVPQGWALASTWGSWEPRTAAALFPWGTNCLAIMDNPKKGFRGWGSSINQPLVECTQKGLVTVNKKLRTYKIAKCSTRILLSKVDTGYKCLPA